MSGLEHGTYSRYQKDLRDGLEPCAACRAASRDYHRAYRLRTGKNQRGCSPGLGWPLADPSGLMARVREAAQ